jgi:hypothetical protein
MANEYTVYRNIAGNEIYAGHHTYSNDERYIHEIPVFNSTKEMRPLFNTLDLDDRRNPRQWLNNAFFIPSTGSSTTPIPITNRCTPIESDIIDDDDNWNLGKGYNKIRVDLNGLLPTPSETKGYIGLSVNLGDAKTDKSTRAPNNDNNTITLNFRKIKGHVYPTKETLIHTLIHEIGHCLNMVPDNSGIIGTGLPDKHTDFYVKHGHSGPHCSFNIPENEKKRGDESYEYGEAELRKARCVMYGSFDSKILQNIPFGFCRNCEKALFKMDLSKGVRKDLITTAF